MKNLLFILFIIFPLIGVIDLQSTNPKSTPKSTQRTTSLPRPVSCYVCSTSTCPHPFPEGGAYVSSKTSSNGWCVKRSSSSDPNAIASRDIDNGDCSYYYGYGCAWRLNIYVCCCHRNYCNTAITKSKLTFSILFFYFIFLLFQKNFF